MYAIILAAGAGTRLTPYTADRPKPMAEINGKPILEYQLRQLKDAGVTDIVIAERFFPETISNYFGNGESLGINIHHRILPEPLLGSAADTKRAGELIPPDEEDVILLFGDIISGVNFRDLINRHKEGQSDITLAVYNFPFPYGVVQMGQDERFAGFSEKPPIPITTGIYALKRNLLQMLPEEGDFSRNFLERLDPKTITIGVYHFDSYWRDIADGSDLAIATKDLREGKIFPEGNRFGRERQ